MNSYTLDLHSINLSDEQFFQLCANNRDLRFERNAKGDLIIMPPTGGESGRQNSELTYQLQAWNRQNKSGVVFDSSTGFKLPNGANRSPDASWIPLESWNNLIPQERQKFLPLCPDFVIELLSLTDSLTTLQEKMQEYIDNGSRLGWLINPKTRQVEIYRRGKAAEVLEDVKLLSGEDVLPGFVLDLEPIW